MAKGNDVGSYWMDVEAPNVRGARRCSAGTDKPLWERHHCPSSSKKIVETMLAAAGFFSGEGLGVH
jgi:hypothetical protein